MANVLDNLAADIYKAADTVGREQVGFVSSVTVNGDASERVAVGGTVRSHFTREATLIENAAPSMTTPEGTDQTVDSKTATISKSANVQIPWTGEDILSVNNGAGFETIYGDQLVQAFRKITNKIEQNLGLDIYVNASRALGTAGTTPFASDFDVIAEQRQILVENGTPMDGQVTSVLSQTAGTKLRNLAQLQKANESASDQLLRNGVLLDLQGVAFKETAQAPLHVKGTGTNYTTTAAGFAVGTTELPLITGTGTVKAGDVVTFVGDTNKYIIAVGISAPGTITLAAPGLRVPMSAATKAMTIGASYTANVALHRSAAELIMRPPAMPKGGDSAVDMMQVQDPYSGMVYELAVYKGYQKMMIDVRCVYGYKTWKPDFVSTLLG